MPPATWPGAAADAREPRSIDPCYNQAASVLAPALTVGDFWCSWALDLLGRFIVSLEHLLQIYGYPVLFVATFVEGETALLVASFLAHRGYLAFPWVVLVAFAGTFSADQFFFYLGRSRGRMYLSRRPAWQAKADRANALLQRYGLPIVIGFRFLYGLRIATPFAVGMSGFSPIRFVLLNAGGGALWSIVIAFLGYSLGNMLTVFLADFRHYEIPVIISILLASAIVWLLYLRCRSRARRSERGPTSG